LKGRTAEKRAHRENEDAIVDATAVWRGADDRIARERFPSLELVERCAPHGHARRVPMFSRRTLVVPKHLEEDGPVGVIGQFRSKASEFRPVKAARCFRVKRSQVRFAIRSNNLKVIASSADVHNSTEKVPIHGTLPDDSSLELGIGHFS
jgi:hypothetical protein